jgi:SCY1-like protein 2
MGNALAKSFDIPKDFNATAGHCSLYKIWHGKKKETNEEVSVWTFDKNDLGKRKTNPISDRAVQEQIVQLMRKDLTALKEAACEGIIKITEIVEDNKNAIVFTTERVVCSLADVLCRFESVSSSVADASFFEGGRTVSEMEISRGLLNLIEGLQYLHTVQRKLHLNISPEAIVITADGNWKFCSFGLSLGFTQEENLQLASPYFLKKDVNCNVIRLEPDLRYYGGELTVGGYNPSGIRYLTPASDIFALGILFYEIFRFNIQKTPHSCIIGVVNNNIIYHQQALNTLEILDYTFLSSQVGLKDILKNMIELNPTSRRSTNAIANSPLFTSGPLSILRLIDNLHTRDIGTQASQLINLPNHLKAFSVRILEGIVIWRLSLQFFVVNPYYMLSSFYTYIQY